MVPDFQMLGVEGFAFDLLVVEKEDTELPSIVLVFVDGSFGFFFDALQANSVGC